MVTWDYSPVQARQLKSGFNIFRKKYWGGWRLLDFYPPSEDWQNLGSRELVESGYPPTYMYISFLIKTLYVFYGLI